MKLPHCIIVLGILLEASVAASVIPASLTEQKCGNGIKEGYELCEPDTAYDICPAIGKLLKIAMVCNEFTCDCLPGKSAKDCGNQIREGVEMCDPGEKEETIDFCPNISAAIGLPLKCDTATCDCVAEGLPFVVSYCGDGKVEGNEDCESDDDCPKSRRCEDCACVAKETELNLTPVEHNVTTDEIPVPTVEDITRRQKNTIAGFVLDDYVGEILPEELDYFDNEEINIYVAMKDGTNLTVSLVTTEMVVQEIHPFALNETSMEVWVGEDTVAEVKAADNRTATIVRLLETGKIAYEPTSFFRRLWFWLFTPF
jgi:hypothetical protein